MLGYFLEINFIGDLLLCTRSSDHNIFEMPVIAQGSAKIHEIICHTTKVVEEGEGAISI